MTLPWNEVGASGTHPNLGGAPFVSAGANAMRRKQSVLRDRAPEIVSKLADVAVERQAFAKIDNNGDWEIWSLQFNSEPLYRGVGISIKLSPLREMTIGSYADWCQVEPPDRFLFYHVARPKPGYTLPIDAGLDEFMETFERAWQDAISYRPDDLSETPVGTPR